MDDFPIQLKKKVKERTVQLQNTVANLEQQVAECKNIQPELNKLSRVFRDSVDAILIEDLTGTITEVVRGANIR